MLIQNDDTSKLNRLQKKKQKTTNQPFYWLAAPTVATQEMIYLYQGVLAIGT